MTPVPAEPHGHRSDRVTADPVLVRRRRIAALVAIGTRLGYGLFGLAVVLFVAGFVWSYEPWLTTTIVAALVVGSIVLAPSIIFGYAVRAAEKEDAQLGTRPRPRT